ncbi:2575_t:CDS:10 [Diversispora eburnea]|uniref:2575_t:CDS:1 n=1 Tax=Diversispora eburnea TaxID=1213867 RepID=A0A9N8Z825_9GLOM|nr:2575_t:CDS:10 [Diversispora eburnea]
MKNNNKILFNKTYSTDSNNSFSQVEQINKLISGAISRTNDNSLPENKLKECIKLYQNLNKDRIKFLNILANDFGVSRENSNEAPGQYVNKDPYGRAAVRAEMILQHTMIPLHDIFFNRINELPGGIKFLVEMRADLLKFIRENNHEVSLASLDKSLRQKLQKLVLNNIDLKRVTWNSHYSILENIRNYEAVHAVTNWEDLKRRVGPGRRIFAFFYREDPYYPLAFIHVALTKEITGNVQSILEEASLTDEEVTCAIFYSITSQPGLSGMELGNILIKQVVEKLQSEFKSLKTFSTLSPIPGFQMTIVKLKIQGSEDEVLNELTKSQDVLKPILMKFCARLNWLGDTSGKI